MKDVFLFLPKGEPFSVLPQAVLDQCGSLQYFGAVELGPGFELGDAEAIRLEIEKQGYSISGPDGIVSFSA